MISQELITVIQKYIAYRVESNKLHKNMKNTEDLSKIARDEYNQHYQNNETIRKEYEEAMTREIVYNETH